MTVGRWTWRRTADTVRRWIRRPRSQTIRVGGIDSAESFGSSRVTTSYPPLAHGISHEDAINELDQRTRAIIADLSRREGRLLDMIEDHDEQQHAISATFDQYVNAQEHQAKQRDRRGIRFEVSGLGLVTLGAIAQALGSLMASP